MVTERGCRDDAQAFDRVDLPPCLAHSLRALSDVGERKAGRARAGREPLQALWQEALGLWHAPGDGQGADVKRAADARPAASTSHLRARRRQAPDHQRRRHALGWPHDRGHVRRVLVDPRIEPTTKRAERARRPAGLARKGSPGAKHARGAHALAALTRVGRTLAQPSAAVVGEGRSHGFPRRTCNRFLPDPHHV